MAIPAPTAETGTVARVALLLRLIAERPGLFSLGELAQACGLPAPTVHRLLDLLAQQGLVAHEKALRSYRIGSELYRISALVRANTPLTQLIRPILAAAASEAAETCYFALYLPAQLAVMYESRVDAQHPLDYRVELNRPLSLLWGASGRAILAHLPEQTVQAALEQERIAQPQGALPEPAALQAELEQVRRQGYCHSRGHRIPGAVGVLAPVFDETGQVYGALGFTVPEQRFSKARLAPLAGSAMAHAAELSRALGARNTDAPTPPPAARRAH